MIRKSLLSVACTAAVLAAIGGALGPLAHAAEKERLETTVRISTALGVETTVSIRGGVAADELLRKALRGSGYLVGDFFLELEEDVYIGLQFAQVENVAITDGLAVVALSDGQEYGGRLIGRFSAKDGREYDLESVSRLEVLSSPGFRDPEMERRLRDRPSELPWKLQVGSPQRLEFPVYDPKFVFEYYSTSGYALGGADRVARSSSFHIEVGESEFVANLEDFQTVALTAADDDASHVSIKLTSNSGVESVGTLRLAEVDDRGTHDAKRWALAGSLPNGVRVALLEPRKATLAQAEAAVSAEAASGAEHPRAAEPEEAAEEHPARSTGEAGVGIVVTSVVKDGNLTPEIAEEIKSLSLSGEMPRPKEGNESVFVLVTIVEVKKVSIVSLGGRGEETSTLSDSEGNVYKMSDGSVRGVEFLDRHDARSPYRIVEGAKAIQVFEVPKDTTPKHLSFAYYYQERWPDSARKNGLIEVDLESGVGTATRQALPVAPVDDE